jgi:Polyketide cyclase / dehydrase and lipid transport
MPSAKRTISIKRSPADVFTYVANGLNGPNWRSGVLDISLVSGDGTGAIYRQGVRGLGGRRIAADYEVTAFEPSRRLAFKAIAGPVRPSGEYTLQETPEGTALTFSLEEPLSGWKRFVFGRPVQQTMDAEMKALDRLKEVLET